MNETITKDTNPKDALATKKLYFSVIPWTVIWELGVALTEGALKYGRYNWRTRGVKSSVYYDAALRHLTSWWEGEEYDPDVLDEHGNLLRLSHITKAIASLTVLRDSMLAGNWVDDRPLSIRQGVSELNDTTGKLVDKYAAKVGQMGTGDSEVHSSEEQGPLDQMRFDYSLPPDESYKQWLQRFSTAGVGHDLKILGS